MTVKNNNPAAFPSELSVGPPKDYEAAAKSPQTSAERDPRSLLDILNSMQGSDAIEFDPPCAVIELQLPDFDAED